jgi:transcriptional regulator with XRE-family HTH domain
VTKEEIIKAVAIRAKALRISKGLTVDDVAEIMGVRRPVVLSIERGRASLEIEEFAGIASALGATMSELAGEVPFAGGDLTDNEGGNDGEA